MKDPDAAKHIFLSIKLPLCFVRCPKRVSDYEDTHIYIKGIH